MGKGSRKGFSLNLSFRKSKVSGESGKSRKSEEILKREILEDDGKGKKYEENIKAIIKAIIMAIMYGSVAIDMRRRLKMESEKEEGFRRQAAGR